MDVILILSIILNVVLGFAFYFRSTINDVVRDWWKKRLKHKEEEKSLLHELHYQLSLYPEWHSRLMMQVMFMSVAKTPEAVRTIESFYPLGEIKERIQKFVVFTNSNELRFSDDVRSGLRELREAANVIDVFQGDHSRMPDIDKRVHETSDRLRRLVEQELKRL